MPAVRRAVVDQSKFQRDAALPFQLRIEDFSLAMADIYDFFGDVNQSLVDKGLQRFDDMLRPAALSGMLSDLLTDALANKSRSLVPNMQHNGHPDLVVRDRYPNNKAVAGTEGIEIKCTRNQSGAVDTHGARDQWMCVFVYDVDNDFDLPSHERGPLVFRAVYLGEVVVDDFRRNARGELGTRTATLHAEGMAKLRGSWIYLDPRPRRAQAWRQARGRA